MTQTVTAADGTIHNFPDEATPEMIAKALGVAAPMRGLQREIALPSSNVLGGFAGTLDFLARAAGSKFGGPMPKMPGIESGTDALGLTNRPDLQPGNQRESIEAAAARGAGASAPFALLGAPVTALASGAAGGVGSMYGERAMPNHPAIGALIGGIPAALLGGGIAGLGERGVNAARGVLGDMGDAYRTAGIPMRLTGDVSGSPFFKTMQAYSAKSLGGAGRTEAAAHDVIGAFGNEVENTARSLVPAGGSTSAQEAGVQLQNSADQWLTNFKTTSNAKHTAVDAAVGLDTPVSTSSVRAVLDDIQSKAAGNKQINAFLQSPLAKQASSMLASAGDEVPWQTARAIRTRIGEYLENPSLIAQSGGAQAKRLYGALTNDLEATAKASPNPDAYGLFKDANAYTSSGHDFIENTLSKITNVPPEQAAMTVLNSAKRGDSLIGPIRQEMPDAANDLAAFKLRDMASATPGQQNASGTLVSPNSFLTDWNALSPEGKAALYQDPNVAQKIGALAKVSEGVRNTQKLVNTSNTAHNASILGMVAGGGEGARIASEMFPESAAAPFIGGVIGGGALPLVNRGISYLGANRVLAPFLAAKGAPAGSAMRNMLIGAEPAATLLGPSPYPPQMLLGNPQQ